MGIDAVLAGGRWCVEQGDSLDVMAALPAASVDLVMCSPPYEDSRTYGIKFKLRGQAWVDWCFARFMECLRVCKGLVAWVVGHGKRGSRRWSAGPALLMADLARAGVWLRNPAIFQRVGISGSGQRDWLRADSEFIVCAGPHGPLPWSDNTAMGHKPKWAPGGEMSHRLTSGVRVNQWGHPIDSGATVVEEGGRVRSRGKRPSHKMTPFGNRPTEACGREGYKKTYFNGKGFRRAPAGSKGGDVVHEDGYVPPVLANPGNVISCKVGGGVMGNKLCHENEAPYPEALCEFFIRSFCPPAGIVLDPFSGSGTTAAVAVRWGRRAIGIDVRESQVKLSRRRIEQETPLALLG